MYFACSRIFLLENQWIRLVAVFFLIETWVILYYFYWQDEEEELEEANETRDVQQEYKEILDWLNDLDQRASSMAEQWSEDGDEDEAKKKRKVVSFYFLIKMTKDVDGVGEIPQENRKIFSHPWATPPVN